MPFLATAAGMRTWRIRELYGCCTGCYWHLRPGCRRGGLHSTNFMPSRFSYDELEAAISVLLEAVPEWADPHPSSVKKDVSALLRTYAPAEQSKRRRIDDILDCPFRELNLIGRSGRGEPISVYIGSQTDATIRNGGLRRSGLYRTHQRSRKHGDARSPYPRARCARQCIQTHRRRIPSGPRTDHCQDGCTQIELDHGSRPAFVVEGADGDRKAKSSNATMESRRLALGSMLQVVNLSPPHRLESNSDCPRRPYLCTHSFRSLG